MAASISQVQLSGMYLKLLSSYKLSLARVYEVKEPFDPVYKLEDLTVPMLC